jgi:hypothetical protein
VLAATISASTATTADDALFTSCGAGAGGATVVPLAAA